MTDVAETLPSVAEQERWMELTLSLARGLELTDNTPVASVIVREGVEIGRGINAVTSKKDPTLHAELVAVRDACQRTGAGKLPGAILYTTMEPCPMCTWAIRCSGIETIVVGARFRDVERVDVGNYAVDTFMQGLGQKLTLIAGVRRDDCVALRRNWQKRTGRVV